MRALVPRSARIGWVLLLFLAASGCSDHAEIWQSSPTWVEPGVWVAANNATDADLRHPRPGPPTTPIPWPTLEAGHVAYLSAGGSADNKSFGVDLRRGAPLQVCFSTSHDPVLWHAQWAIVAAWTDIRETSEQVRARLDRDGCADVDATVQLERLNVTRVRANGPGEIQVTGEGFVGQVVATAMQIDVDEKTRIRVDATDRVVVSRFYDFRQEEALNLSEMATFANQAFLGAGLPAPKGYPDTGAFTNS